MEVIQKHELDDLATVFIARAKDGAVVEFVESVQPPFSRQEKEVLVISTLAGCPVRCKMCDAGGFYKRKLSADEIVAQIAHVVNHRYGTSQNGAPKVDAKKFKIQFARMGEPSLNDDVLVALERLPLEFDAPGLLISLSTVAPVGRDKFFERLLEVKNELYRGRFQLQFSIHSTDKEQRDRLIPIKKWGFAEISKFGERFMGVGVDDRKVTLNFALGKDAIVDPELIRDCFNPAKFLIKITPLNPTHRASENGLTSGVDALSASLPHHPALISQLREFGFEVILSIGELGENEIGSNCGQYVRRHMEAVSGVFSGYSAVKRENLPDSSINIMNSASS